MKYSWLGCFSGGLYNDEENKLKTQRSLHARHHWILNEAERFLSTNDPITAPSISPDLRLARKNLAFLTADFLKKPIQ
jgi:hypothetical protein